MTGYNFGVLESLLTERDRAFLGEHNVALFLSTLESDPGSDGRFPSSIIHLMEFTKGTYEPDAPIRPMHGTLDPDAWNAAIMWMVRWCEINSVNPWHIKASSILEDLNRMVTSDARATEKIRSRVIVAAAMAES